MKGLEIREKFLKFFEGRGHQRFPSASLIPTDPGVLLTMAGMLPFKPYFLGVERAPYPRVTSVQKCVRTSDIDQVGNTPRHQTFFEMLGNFSFGDYFKRDAIAWGYEWMTTVAHLPKDRLWVAVYQDDTEAFDIWRQDIGIATDHIAKLDEENNFWSAGPTGPCGPCSEIYWDFGVEAGCQKSTCAPGCDCDRFLEIWNLVFMEYNRDAQGKLHPLPKKNVDTGMGLERIAQILQNVPSNFHTDLLLPIYQWVEKHAQGDLRIAQKARSLRIVADHARAAVFLLGDGITPSNTGRGYILRRLLRRAILHGERLGIPGGFLPKLAQEIFRLYEIPYPEIILHRNLIEQFLHAEEGHFRETLQDGLEMYRKVTKGLTSGQTLGGESAFVLHDTYGFPIEMTKELVEDLGANVDMEGFESALTAQQERSRGSGEDWKKSLPAQGTHGPTKFLGYEVLECEATVIGEVRPGPWMALDQTPFYPEGGGQIGDTGTVDISGKSFRIHNTQGNFTGTIYHLVDEAANIPTGLRVKVKVDRARREHIRNHHSATHLLHQALKVVLGAHAKQAGSLVAPDRLRFDFSHPKAMTPEEIQKAENLVNEKIKASLKGSARVLPIDQARTEGAVMMFGEKYGEHVRVMSFGDFSKELCGGTHVHDTRDIGSLKIVSETAIGQGMRRIEAVAGPAVVEYYEARVSAATEDIQKLRDRMETLQARTGKRIELPRTGQRGEGGWEETLRSLADEKERLKGIVASAGKEVALREMEGARTKLENALEIRSDIATFPIAIAEIDDIPPDALRACADAARDKVKKGGVFILSRRGDTSTILLAFTKEIAGGSVHAGQALKKILGALGGGGGGGPELAQGGLENAPPFSMLMEDLKGVLRTNG